jgi:hypothetical protein
MMALLRSTALATATAMMCVTAASGPLQAQSFEGRAPSAKPTRAPTYNPPAIPYPYYPYLGLNPKDDRTARQRCVEGETERLGRSASDLDRKSIDLKCSQR